MKIITGKVISKTNINTAKVLVERVIVHPKYKKRYKTHKKYQVHDIYDVKLGDIVNFVACRPMSKTKKWKIIILKKNKK